MIYIPDVKSRTITHDHHREFLHGEIPPYNQRPILSAILTHLHGVASLPKPASIGQIFQAPFLLSVVFTTLCLPYTCRSPAVSFVVSDVQWFWLKTRHFNRNVRLNGVGGQQDSCWCSRQPPCSLHWSTFQERKNCECHWYRETVDGNRAWDAHITVSQKWFRHSASKLTNRGLV